MYLQVCEIDSELSVPRAVDERRRPDRELATESMQLTSVACIERDVYVIVVEAELAFEIHCNRMLPEPVEVLTTRCYPLGERMMDVTGTREQRLPAAECLRHRSHHLTALKRHLDDPTVVEDLSAPYRTRERGENIHAIAP